MAYKTFEIRGKDYKIERHLSLRCVIWAFFLVIRSIELIYFLVENLRRKPCVLSKRLIFVFFCQKQT